MLIYCPIPPGKGRIGYTELSMGIFSTKALPLAAGNPGGHLPDTSKGV
jgi:hypothetical protein